eukprot:Opistho-2@50248
MTLLRIRSREKTERVEVPNDANVGALLAKVATSFGIPEDQWRLSVKPNGEDVVNACPRAEKLVALNIKHGDMLFLETAARANGSASAASLGEEKTVVEDDVDKQLQKLDGTIRRGKDAHFCKHGANGMCDYCAPLEPYDGKYLESQGIKHMSFHSYLRKLFGGVDKGKFALLEDLDYGVKQGCKGHAPWPEGICSKCQPGAVTLNRQVYRHVDFIEFESPRIVDRFIQYWRQSGGHQRLGYLYGKYAPHADVPLGIKAMVMAIYEPPQDTRADSLELLADPNEEAVDQMAAALGLRRVGWIITDLEDDGTGQGKVRYKRHGESYFLTSAECIMAGDLQTKYPNACALSRTGKFGSKFVSVIVSGHADGGVGIEAYQVSNQCMALTRAGYLLPSRKDLSLGRIKASTPTLYVPDVMYSYKNEYGSDVTVAAKPTFPLDYLIVSVASGAPHEPSPMFDLAPSPFTIENRLAIRENQDMARLRDHLRQNTMFLALVSDFHLLVHFVSNPQFAPVMADLPRLYDAILRRDGSAANAFRLLPSWKAVEGLANSTRSTDPPTTGGRSFAPAPSVAAPVASGPWACQHCTYINITSRDACEMCGLPS